jgi:hypothetical protein
MRPLLEGYAMITLHIKIEKNFVILYIDKIIPFFGVFL